MSTNHEFHEFHLESKGRPQHRHSRRCPGCSRWVAPYDDEPWHEGQEWTSAHRCRACDLTFTSAWQYPSGEPEPSP